MTQWRLKKATLRQWRAQFSRHLRDLGVAANATERAVRGENRINRKDGVYRASLRGNSSYVRAQMEPIVAEHHVGGVRTEEAMRALWETRFEVVKGWNAVTERLKKAGERALAADVVGFIDAMDQPRTARELMAREWLAAWRRPQREAGEAVRQAQR